MGPSNNARDLLIHLCSAFSAGDLDTIDQLFSNDDQVLLIGSDPQEWLQGHRSIIGTLRMQLAEMGGSLNIRAVDPIGSSDSTTGWAADRPVVGLPDGSRVRARASVFGRAEEDGWKIVHLHFSLGVGNEESIGHDLSVA